jgi:hypothetical protein
VSGLDEDHLERLRTSDPATWPPLLVAPNDIGGYDVIDGFHRLQVAQERGLEGVPCEVEAGVGYLEAVFANQQHGLPLSRRDRKRFARWLHAAAPDLSLRQLGENCSLDPKTVKRAIEEDEAGEEHDEGEENPRHRETHSQHAAPVAKLVRTLCSKPLVTYFSLLPSLEDRADEVWAEIADYDEESQSSIAQCIVLIGQALVEGARQFLS